MSKRGASSIFTGSLHTHRCFKLPPNKQPQKPTITAQVVKKAAPKATPIATSVYKKYEKEGIKTAVSSVLKGEQMNRIISTRDDIKQEGKNQTTMQVDLPHLTLLNSKSVSDSLQQQKTQWRQWQQQNNKGQKQQFSNEQKQKYNNEPQQFNNNEAEQANDNEAEQANDNEANQYNNNEAEQQNNNYPTKQATIPNEQSILFEINQPQTQLSRNKSQQEQTNQASIFKQPQRKYYRTNQPSFTLQTKQEIQVKLQRQQPKTNRNRSKQFKQQLVSLLPPGTDLSSTHRWSYGDGHTPASLLITTWNVNGIRSVLSKKLFYPYLLNNKPDILCLCQTKVNQKNFDSSPIKVQGYHGYWNFAKHSSGYSGVAVFSKYMPKSLEEDLLESQFSQQGRIMTLQFQRFVLINIYMPTVGKELQRLSYRQKFDAAFRSHVLRTRQKFKLPVIIVGDLNVAYDLRLDASKCKDIMLTPSCTVGERKGFTQLLALGFVDVFRTLHPDKRAYTWWFHTIGGRQALNRPGLGRRIDYCLVPKQQMCWVKRCQILREVFGADHCPVEMEIDMQKEEEPTPTYMYPKKQRQIQKTQQ